MNNPKPPKPVEWILVVSNQPTEPGLYPASVVSVYISDRGDPYLVVKVTEPKDGTNSER